MSKRLSSSRRASLALVALMVAGAVGGIEGAGPGAATASASTRLSVSGHGWGHGQGMGQWGAEGYALKGWTYQQILAHYYGGTALKADPNPTTYIEVQITELAGDNAVIVSSASSAPLKVDGKITSSRRKTLSPGHSATSSNGGDVSLVFGGKAHLYPGTISLSGGQVYDKVSLLKYVEGVVPFESAASWKSAALEAQAVAARSYALEVTSNGARPICDNAACQVFGGDPSQVGSEAANSNAAVAATYSSGKPLAIYCTSAYRSCGAAGTIALAMYSASTGGYTAGGLFPAVPDAGDSIAPEHTWRTTVSAAAVQRTFPTIGTLKSIKVTDRNGHGDMGGRVLTVALAGSKGSESVSGEYFADVLGFESDWFSLSLAAPAPLPAPAPPKTITGPGHAVAMVRTSDGRGYWIASSGGHVYAYGDARSYGSVPDAPTVAMARTPDNRGYWTLMSTGGVYAFGDAEWYGSLTGKKIAGHVVSIVVTPNGRGYWLVSSSGGVYPFGNAGGYGSLIGHKVSGSIVAAARTPNGKGYWLISSGGGVYGLGNAKSFGSLVRVPVAGMSSTPSTRGHWIVATTGGVYVFGGAPWYRSLNGKTKSVVAISGTGDGKGYWILTSNGVVSSFGDAKNYGHPSL